jgi:hypothetical protein
MKTKIASFRIALLIACFSLSQNAVAVTPRRMEAIPEAIQQKEIKRFLI